jgi:hypothetical protein
MDLDRDRLDYYQALAVLHRLCFYGRCRQIGSGKLGVKASVACHLHRKSLDRLCNRLEEITGVRLYLASKPWELIDD